MRILKVMKTLIDLTFSIVVKCQMTLSNYGHDSINIVLFYIFYLFPTPLNKLLPGSFLTVTKNNYYFETYFDIVILKNCTMEKSLGIFILTQNFF